MTETRREHEERHTWRSPIALFAILMLALGLTLGATAVFSRTSVSNTVLELLVGIALAGAGLFAVRKEVGLTPPRLLRNVALVVLFLLAGYWTGWIGAGHYRESLRVLGTASISDGRDELIAYEIRTYAMLLDIPHSVYTDRVELAIQQDEAVRTGARLDPDREVPASCALESQYVLRSLREAVEGCTVEPALAGRAGAAAQHLENLHIALNAPDALGPIATQRVLTIDALNATGELLPGADDLSNLFMNCADREPSPEIDKWRSYLLLSHFDQCRGTLLRLRDEYIGAAEKYRSLAPSAVPTDLGHLQLETFRENRRGINR